MRRINDRNLYNIQHIFENETQVRFEKKQANYYRPRRAALVLTAVLALCLLTAFTYPLFSPLAGDALDLSATYEGGGIVTVTVENHSGKTLTFQPQLKLLEWITEKEIAPAGGQVSFSGTTVAPHSTATLTIDLSEGYDMARLEKSPFTLWHCLVLTNQNFLFGQEWKCSVQFGPRQLELPRDPGNWAYVEPQILERMEPELREYFQEEYVEIFAAYPGHYTYLQKVQEVMLRSGKRFVQPVSPILPILPIPDGVIVDDQIPADRQYTLASFSSSVQDVFGKLVSGSYNGHIRYLYAPMEYLHTLDDGTIATYCWQLPLLYFSTYPKAMMESPEDCALIHGQIWSFRELAPMQVYEDDQYVVYNVTSLYYTDLEAYVQHTSAKQLAYGNPEQVVTEQQFRRIENILAYYDENLKILPQEEYAQIRPYCRLENDEGLPDLHLLGLQGTVLASHPMHKLSISILDTQGNVLREFILHPQDSRSYDLADAAEASAYIRSLPSGTYHLDIDAWLTGTIHSHTGVAGRMFTVE